MFSAHHENNLTIFRSSLIESQPDIQHAFSTRNGGVSPPPYNSLNLGNGAGDSDVNVSQNRVLFLKILQSHPEQLALGEQVHGNNIEIVKHPGSYPAADGLVTTEKNIVLAIKTADCTPVLMVDPINNVLAAVHAGWKSVKQNIIRNTVDILKNEFAIFPENILCAIGPSIRSCCYEIQQDVAGQFDKKAVIHRNNRLYLDLLSVIGEQLQSAGLTQDNIDTCDICTCCHSDLFFSYRRDGAQSGRMMMAAVMN